MSEDAPVRAGQGVPSVRFDGVYKSFGELSVLAGLDLSVGAGEKLAILGPSGSGKSTLLRILMTLEGIDRGRVEVEGEALWESAADGSATQAGRDALHRIRSCVGMVFQQFHLFPHLSALENVMLAPRRVRGFSRDQAREHSQGYLARVGLADKCDAYPAQLSGGQKQRVAIARALAMQPRIMLFDEVTSALDPELVGEVLEIMRLLAREGEVTMLIVTHQIEFAREIADRVVFMDGGVVVEQGPPKQILEAPREPRTREFLRAVVDR